MQVQPLAIPDVRLITPKRHGDARGTFTETYHRRRYAEAAGIHEAFVQDNESWSAPVGTLRGLHYQAPPFAQGKLVRVLRGRIWDVAVDIRAGSASFGRHVGAELDAASGAQLWVPAGFAHGFVTLEADTRVAYKVTAHYAPDHDRGLAWDDPDLAIPWPMPVAAPVLSDKDRRWPRLAEVASPFTAGGGP